MRPDIRKRLADSIETAVGIAEGMVEIELVPSEGGGSGTEVPPTAGEVRTYSERFACLHCGTSMPELEPRMFSFNSPHGACPRCTGLGSQMEIDPELIVPDPSLSLGEGAILPWSTSASNYYDQMTQAIAERYEVDMDTSWYDLPEDVQDCFLYGTSGDRLYISYRNRFGRRRFLDNVGVGYLSLERAAGTLSGGEAQRIRLATQIGSSLVGVLYILDEPSIGLHQRDNARLIATLERLRDLGNTVIVVEHDEGTMRAADHIVDLGPGAGEHGGRLVAEGTVEEVMGVADSLTGQFLAGRQSIPIPAKRRKPLGWLTVEGAKEHNLKGINVKFPLGTFTCVTGVSGSGKSTLVNEILYKAVANRLHRAKLRPGAHRRIRGLEHLDKIISVDQSPIGRTPRSNPATYIGLFDQIRDLFSKTQEARARGYKPGRFSFNVKGGRCEVCRGDGQIKIEMHFLPDVYVPCEQCHGKRYNRETLEVRFKGKNISDILEMPLEEALHFFAHIPKIRRRVQTLNDVGLGYMRLGQPATTLSGGEAQRIKLAAELCKVATGRTIYILDEPTTGLHFADIQRLLEVLQRLVDAGNTVVVIEHNLDVIKVADRLIDLGPEGGDEGGRLIATGTPEQVATVAESYTARFLAELLGRPARARKPTPPRAPRGRRAPAAAAARQPWPVPAFG